MRSCRKIRPARALRCSVGVAKRTLPLPAGRRVRWTIEVLPDAEAKPSARAKKTARTPRRARSPVKKSRVPVPPPVEPSQPARLSPTAPPPAIGARTKWLRAFVPVAAVILVIALVAFPRRPPAPVVAETGTQPDQPAIAADAAPRAARIAPTPVPSAAPVAASIVVTPRAVNEPPKKPTTPVMHRVPSIVSPAPVSTAAAVTDPPRHEEPATTPAAADAPAAAVAPTTASLLSAPVTVTGCLEVSTDGDTFRLNDVEGADAPKSRSWRTGFLKKRPAPVMLVDPPDRQALTTHVGRRVAATGQLINRDLKVSALHVVGASCN